MQKQFDMGTRASEISSERLDIAQAGITKPSNLDLALGYTSAVVTAGAQAYTLQDLTLEDVFGTGGIATDIGEFYDSSITSIVGD